MTQPVSCPPAPAPGSLSEWPGPGPSCLRRLHLTKAEASRVVSTPGHQSLSVVKRARKPSTLPTSSLSSSQLAGFQTVLEVAFSPILVLKDKQWDRVISRLPQRTLQIRERGKVVRKQQSSMALNQTQTHSNFPFFEIRF